MLKVGIFDEKGKLVAEVTDTAKANPDMCLVHVPWELAPKLAMEASKFGAASPFELRMA